MICKWCGAKIREKDRSCPRCGQELPPLSECGGFYDLVPGARQGVIPPATPVPPVSPVPPANGSTGHYPPRKKKKNYGTLWLCVWAVLLFAVIALSVKSCSLSHELDALDDRLSKVEKQSDKDATDGSEAAGDGNSPTSTVSVKLSLNVTDDDGTIEEPDDDNWSCSKDSDDEDYYQLTYIDDKLIDLHCVLEEKLWTVETKGTDSDISFQWQAYKDSGLTSDWSDLKAVEHGGSSTCPEDGHDGDSKLRCILNWEQDEEPYEITVYFPSDLIRLTLNVNEDESIDELNANEWIVSKISGDDTFYRLTYDNEPVLELSCTWVDDHWRIEHPFTTDVQISYQWEKKDSDSESDWSPIENGNSKDCPSVQYSLLHCILKWEQDEKSYEVTIDFPSDPTK